MDWVKRNLYFLIGSLVALVLMGLAGFYLYRGLRHNNDAYEKLSQQFAELRRLYELNPNPGNEKVDNIRAARQQQEQLRGFIGGITRYFVPVPAIPSPEGTNKVTSEEFTAALRQTIALLERQATASGVSLPPKNPQTGAPYYFSFEAQRTLVRFAPGSLEPLSVQLGEVKAISDILFEAKINALDSIRRERVSTNDNTGPYSDYLPQSSVTNKELAILTPYEITLRCFSAELARVLNGFRSSPYCVLAKTIDVDPAPAAIAGETIPGMTPTPGIPGYTPTPTMIPSYPAPAGAAEGAASAAAAFRRRYSMGAEGGRMMGPGAYPGRPGMPNYPTPTYPTPTYPAPGAYGQVAPVTRGGLQTVIDEKLLRVTLTVHVVKLLPKETKETKR